ncbi:MAG: hypothetical protein CO171_08535 [Syntrophobacterales bacterium CG_4_9_14_3_um_filter_49_8]|nr:MAG: hypothetical protein CO171_08535 [Syntrophobacterales bacterium CG_4_9_14_3_um_filter_49_8]
MFFHHLRPKIWEHAVEKAYKFSSIRRRMRCQPEFDRHVVEILAEFLTVKISGSSPFRWVRHIHRNGNGIFSISYFLMKS